MTYDVTDGSDLDEDGEENGIIIDPVGLAEPVSNSSEESETRSSSIGYRSTPLNQKLTEKEVCITNDFKTLMKKGSRYGEIAKLQQVLNDLGLNTGNVDGLFGPITEIAVKKIPDSEWPCCRWHNWPFNKTVIEH